MTWRWPSNWWCGTGAISAGRSSGQSKDHWRCSSARQTRRGWSNTSACWRCWCRRPNWTPEGGGCGSMPEPAELLAGRVARGDDAAAEDLVEAMRPLVASMATRFQGRGPRSDLEQAGVVGLLRAAATFDAERGTPFGGYAAPFVMGEMLACVRQQSAPVRVPRSVTENERAVAASVDLLTAT